MNRKIAPELSIIDQIELIFPERIDLGNGIDLVWMKNIPDNTVKLDIIWNAGSKYQLKPLIASFCNHLLLSGNKSISANEIAEEIDSLGGYVSHNQHKDHAGITAFGLTDSIDGIFDIIQSNLLQCIYPETEIEKWKEIKKKEFELNKEKVDVNARKLFTQNIFGINHPYGKIAKIADFDNVSQNDLQKFFQEKYMNNKPTIFLVGNVNQDFINKLTEFAQHFTDKNTENKIGFPIQRFGEIYKTKADAVQSAIRIGRLCIDKNHPDYITFQILNTILGGYFGSRLMANIREDKGYTYGIGSGISAFKDATYFFISTEVAREKRKETLNEIYFELRRLQTELVQVDELAVVKNYMLGALLRNSDGAIAMMEKYKNIYLQNLDESYYLNYIRGINSVTPEKLQAVAIQYFNKKDFTEISYG